ncbi:unnamed protein product [Auanema sp. JU1783]|nr:unnamed protein product [Auanema sp. JU1783]
MDICFVLNLLDHDGVSHCKMPSIFKKETSIEQLNEFMRSVWQINVEYQELFLNEQQILTLDSTLEELGVKKGDEIVVKHSRLHAWVACLMIADNLTKQKAEHLNSKNAKMGVQLLNNLDSNSFFSTYSRFLKKRIEISELFDRYVIGI